MIRLLRFHQSQNQGEFIFTAGELRLLHRGRVSEEVAQGEEDVLAVVVLRDAEARGADEGVREEALRRPAGRGRPLAAQAPDQHGFAGFVVAP